MKDPIIEKLYNTVREILIHQHGEDFLELTEKEQDALISSTFVEYMKAQKERQV